MRFADPVEVVRGVVTAATSAPTARVLQPGFTEGPMPLVHVHAIQSVDVDFERVTTLGIDVYATTPTNPGTTGAEALADAVVEALRARPVVSAAGWVDSAEIQSTTGVRPYYGEVETVGLVADIVHRPIED